MFIHAVGTRCLVNGDIRGIVIAICINSYNHIEYNIRYWWEGEATSCWFRDFEVDFENQKPGFRMTTILETSHDLRTTE